VEVFVEGLIVLLIGALVFGPIVLSIVALSTASRASREVRELKATLARQGGLARDVAAPAPAPAPASEPLRPPPMPVSTPERDKLLEELTGEKPPPMPAAVARAQEKQKSDRALEVALGGKAASFIGIAAMVLAVVFFVGYAIQNGWIGPGTRIVLGLLSGGVLVALGHVAEVRGRNLGVLARALTGGGSALFYFCVFAAFNIYNLIGPALAGAGLVASAAAVLALSALYNSQAIGVLGLLGAYITPVLIRGDFSEGIFPLAYIAVVNIPVIAMGVRRNWQVLQSLGTLFTTILMAAWLAEELPGQGADAWQTGLAFVFLYYGEFAVLGLLKIGKERTRNVLAFDILRVLFLSLALLGALEWILAEADYREWRGAAYLVIAVAHIGLVQLARRKCPEFKEEVLAFTIVALTFASLALPAQLDGAWVSLGWGFEGVLLAWFALRIRSPILQAGAMGLGLLGLGKSIVFDVTLYDAPPQLFLNGRFCVGILSSLLLGVQGYIHDKAPHVDEKPSSWPTLLWCLGLLGAVGVFFGDSFFTLTYSDPWAWMITTMAICGVGLVATLASGNATVASLGLLLLLVVPIKIVLFDIGASRHYYGEEWRAFQNGIFFLRILVILAGGVWFARLAERDQFAGVRKQNLPVITYIVSALAVLWIVTVEIGRIKTGWSDGLITLWWAVSAFALIITGLARRRAYMRYLGLAIITVTVLKVIFFDTAGLQGLERISVFFGVGLLMLILSYAYQRVAPKLMAGGELERGE